MATSPAIVHVWCVDTSAEIDAAVLSHEDREVAARFHFERDRIRYISSHVELRKILSRYVEVAPEAIEFGKEGLGKPFLALPARKVSFNLAHSGDRALIAVSSGAEIGVDIERIRDEADLSDVAKRYFSAGENDWLKALEEPEQLRGFYRLWTLKEACLKAAGTGLSLAPGLFELTIEGDRIGIASREPALGGPWDIRELSSELGYCAAVAARGTIGELASF